ncbi:zinc finger protein-like protein [Pycnococcus provasolii]
MALDAAHVSVVSMQTSSSAPPIYGLSSVHRAIAAGLRTFASSASQLDLAVRSPQHQPSTLNCNTVITREVAARLERLSAQFQFLEALLLTHSVGEDAGIYVEQLNQEQQETNQRQQKQRTQHKQPQQPQQQEQQQQQQPPEEHNPHHHDGSEEEQWHIVGTMLRELHGDLRRNGALPCEKTRTLAEHAMGAANHIIGHMEEEERDILPKLARTCSHANQCKLVWKTLSSMHLRMLEQVLPWLAEHLSKHNMSSLVATVSCAVPPDDPLRALLSRWQEEHREPALEQSSSSSSSSSLPLPLLLPLLLLLLLLLPPQAAATTTTASDDDESTRSAKRARTAKRANSEEPSTTEAANGTTTTKQEISETAIDHIFDIHKAILRELDSLSESASRLVMLGREHALSHAHAGGGGETASSPPQVRTFAGPQLDGDEEWLCKWDAALGDISGRFEYLRSFYEAHSKAEDDIVFPALESKKLLRNVFKSYQADHERESNLFQDLSTTITSLKTKREARRFLAAAANPDGVKLEHAEVANEEEAADADADATARQQLLHAPQEAAPHSRLGSNGEPLLCTRLPHTRSAHQDAVQCNPRKLEHTRTKRGAAHLAALHEALHYRRAG